MVNKEKLFHYLEKKWTGYQHPDGWRIESILLVGVRVFSIEIRTTFPERMPVGYKRDLMTFRRIMFFRRLERMYSINVSGATNKYPSYA